MSRRRPNIPAQPAVAKAFGIVQFDTSTESGRARLWQARILRATANLEIDKRVKDADYDKRFLDGRYARTPGKGEVYLNEALPALEDVIFAPLTGALPVTVEWVGQDGEGAQLTTAIQNVADQFVNSDVSRIRRAVVKASWDDITYGIGYVKAQLTQDAWSSRSRPTTEHGFLDYHVRQAAQENQNVAQGLMLTMAETDDDRLHAQVHEEQLASEQLPPDAHRRLARHAAAHAERMIHQVWTYPVLRRVAFERFLLDPDAEEWETRRWEAEKCFEYIGELARLPGARNVTPENCQPIDEFGTRAAKVNDFDFQNMRAAVWRVHDKLTGEYAIIPDTPGDPLPIVEADWPFGSADIYSCIVGSPVEDSIAGRSRLKLVVPILYKLAEVNRDILSACRKAASAKLVGAKGMIDAVTQASLADPERHYTEIAAGALAMYKEWRPPEVSAKLLEFRDILLNELRRMVGSDAIDQGADTMHAITATETRARGGSRHERVTRRQSTLSELLAWTVSTFLALYHEFGEEAIPVRVLNDMGRYEAYMIQPSSIPKDIRVVVDLRLSSDDRKAEEIVAANQFTQAIMALPPGTVDLRKWLTAFGVKLGIRDPAQYLQPPMMPLPAAPGAEGEAGSPAPGNRAGGSGAGVGGIPGFPGGPDTGQSPMASMVPLRIAQ